MNAPTDEQLLRAHLEGDGAAFRSLLERHHGELFNFVYRFTRNASATEDIVQNAFLQTHLAATSFDFSRRFKPWLFTIAANKARDHLRSRTRRREVPLDAQIGGEQEPGKRFLDLLEDHANAPPAQLAEQERSAIVRAVVDAMPDNLTEVLVLAYFHQFPYRDIAEVLGIPLGTVKSRLHAAVHQFAARYRALVQQHEEENA